jgi:hypothetical protein
MGYNARNDEIRDNITRMRREWEAQCGSIVALMALIRTLPIFLTTLAVMVLCGCASLLVSPDKYILYSCPELKGEADGIAGRQHELEALMKKAGVDAGGRFVSNQVYAPEYTQLRGQMDQLRKTAAEKNCNLSAGVKGE